MKNLTIIIKTIFSVLIVFVIIAINFMSVAIAGSSHNITDNDRSQAIFNGRLAIILGPIFIVCLWLPWTKWLRTKNNK